MIVVLRYLGAAGGLAAGYVLAGWLGHLLTQSPGMTGMFWLPGGAALAGLLLRGYRMWPAITLGSAVLAYLAGEGPSIVTALAIGSTASALGATWLLRNRTRFDLRLQRVEDVLSLALNGALAGPLVGAAAFALTLALFGQAREMLHWAWLASWLASGGGVVVVTPLVLRWRVQPDARGATGSALEGVVVLLLVLMAAAFGFGFLYPPRWGDIVGLPLTFLPFPFLAWIAMRLELQWAVSAIALTVGTAALATASGYGPFVEDSAVETMTLLATYGAAAALTTLVLGVASAARLRAEDRLRQLTKVVRRIGAVHDTHELMAILRRAARQLIGADGVDISLREGDECYYADEDAIGPLWKGQRLALDNCICGRVVRHGETLAIENVYADTRIAPEVFRPTFVKSLALVPIGREHPRGAIGCYWATHHRTNAGETALQQALADAAAVALANIDLYRSLEKARDRAESNAIELEASEARFRSIYTQAVVGIVGWGLDGVIRNANPAYYRLLGYHEPDLIGKRLDEIVAPQDLEAAKLTFARLVAEGTGAYEVTRRYLRLDGRQTWCRLLVSVICDRRGRPDHIIAIAQDISEQVFAEQGRRASESFKDKLLASSLNAIDIYNLQSGQFRFINAQYTELTGYTLDALNAMSEPAYRALIHSADQARVAQHWDALRHAADDDVLEVEYRFMTADGRWIWCLSHDAVFDRDENGAVRQVFRTFLDITARREAEREAERRRIELIQEQRRATMGEIVSSLAHQINQPLAALTGYCDAALMIAGQGGESPADMHYALTEACNEAQRASLIVRNLRDLLSDHPHARVTVDIDTLIQGALGYLTYEVAQQGVKLRYEAPNATAEALLDRSQIEQVLVGLLHNSVEAMERADSPVREITVRVATTPDRVQVSVQDSGPGLAPEKMEGLFETFGHDTGGGLGIGLPLCRSVVEAHGGRLWAESPAVGGAAFHFSLPLTERLSKGEDNHEPAANRLSG